MTTWARAGCTPTVKLIATNSMAEPQTTPRLSRRIFRLPLPRNVLRLWGSQGPVLRAYAEYGTGFGGPGDVAFPRPHDPPSGCAFACFGNSRNQAHTNAPAYTPPAPLCQGNSSSGAMHCQPLGYDGI